MVCSSLTLKSPLSIRGNQITNLPIEIAQMLSWKKHLWLETWWKEDMSLAEYLVLYVMSVTEPKTRARRASLHAPSYRRHRCWSQWNTRMCLLLQATPHIYSEERSLLSREVIQAVRSLRPVTGQSSQNRTLVIAVFPIDHDLVLATVNPLAVSSFAGAQSASCPMARP